MHMERQRNCLNLVRVVTLGLVWSVGAVAADHEPGEPGNALDKANACTGTYGFGVCAAVAKHSGATVYAEPNINSRVIVRWKHGEGIGTLEPASKLDKAEWVPIGIAVAGPKGPFSRVITAYVPRSQVILYTDFRRVVGCWPLKAAGRPEAWVDDIVPQYVWFTPAGVATAWDPSATVDKDQKLVRETFARYGEQRVYYADGVFLALPEKNLDLRLYYGTIDYEKRTVRYAGTERLDEGVQWFSPGDLKGCKQIPITDDTPPPIPKALAP